MNQVGEWWYNDSGENQLSGVADDPNNPIMLEDYYILDFLSSIPAAVESFYRVVPTMLPAEQDRLYALARQTPNQDFMDPKAALDKFQSNWNKAGIHLPHVKR